MRVTVGMIVGLVASEHTTEGILKFYAYLEAKDIAEALAYAVWRVEEIDVPQEIREIEGNSRCKNDN